jgi:hypothetical protein
MLQIQMVADDVGSGRGLETGPDGKRTLHIRNADGPERSLSRLDLSLHKVNVCK